jgi:Outer membrane protein TOM13
MADSPPTPPAGGTAPPPTDLSQSGITIRSDSETYDAPSSNALLSSPRFSGDDSPSPVVVLYRPPTLWGLLRGAAINLVLPFVNGLMLGFGELFAHEIAFRLGWSGTKVRLSAFRWWWSTLADWGG